MELYGLADCNNFFVSCERVFRPDLRDKPVLVLSNNDGCVISRSNEVKELGIAMGTPFFKIQKEIERHNITVFSSNYVLYGDLSHRVMSILSKFTPHLDQYSIDEAFLDLSEMGDETMLTNYGHEIVDTVAQWVDIPISLGIAPTRTLAKVASRYAKKYKGYHGVCLINTEEKRIKALKLLPIGDVFGIGRKLKVKLQNVGIENAWDFTQLSPEWVRHNYSLSALKTWRELRGETCIEIDTFSEKQSICTSRSFADNGISEHAELEEAVANFASECARKLREQKSCCKRATVFAYTSRFKTEEPQDYINCTIVFDSPTNDTTEIIHTCIEKLRQCYKSHAFAYKKAGVIVWDIVSQTTIQRSLFEARDREKQMQLMNAIDILNKKNGKGTVRTAIQSKNIAYKAKREHVSPLYTTEMNEMLTLHAK